MIKDHVSPKTEHTGRHFICDYCGVDVSVSDGQMPSEWHDLGNNTHLCQHCGYDDLSYRKYDEDA